MRLEVPQTMPVTRVEWRYAHPRASVWAAVLDIGHWPVGFDDFRPEPGQRYSGGPIPAVGTDYVGRLDVEVTEVVAHTLVAVRVSADRRGASPSRWDVRSELFDTPHGGTTAVTSISGLDAQAPHERTLLGILGSITGWIYGHANDALDYPDRGLPGRLSRGRGRTNCEGAPPDR